MPVFGIDLGTTYSCIAYVDDTDRVVILQNAEGTNTTPSVVGFFENNNVSAGQIAKDNAVIEPLRTVQLVKSLMGKSTHAITVDGVDYNPEAISALILRKLTHDAAAFLGISEEDVKDVVITCPAYFGTAEIEATRNAGVAAGLNVLAIIKEPVAAALAYGLTRGGDDRTVLVYDLGGGTFDVTIIKIRQREIEVVSTDGNHDLGGKNWDEELMKYLWNRFSEETGYDGELDPYSEQDLRLKVEKAKIQLTSRETTKVAMDVAGLRHSIDLTRAVFEEITNALLCNTIDKTNDALAAAKLKGVTQIDEIILVGGSTYMPQVMDIVRSTYGGEIKMFEPNEAVAKGAALYAKDRSIYEEYQAQLEERAAGRSLPPGPDGSELPVTPPPGVTLINVTSKSFGLKALNANNDYRCFNLILRNSRVPATATETFYTQLADQRSAELVVYESEEDAADYEVNEKRRLGEAVLDLPPGLPKETEIEVSFNLDDVGMLTITGRQIATNREVQAVFRAEGILTQQQVEATAALVRSKSIY